MSELLIAEDRRKLFTGTLLLGQMAETGQEFDALLLDGAGPLESVLTWLLTRELVEFSEKNFYQVSSLGHATAAAFQKRYQKILQYFEVFSAVDLGEGEFAFASFENFQYENQWLQFLHDDRWEDLRLPVAEYLGGDSAEMVFIHFMKEGRFDFQQAGWEIALTAGEFWPELENVLETRLRVDDLAYEDVSGTEVLADVVEQGFLLVRELSDQAPEVMSHLERWAPSRQAADWKPDASVRPFWKTRWKLEVK